MLSATALGHVPTKMVSALQGAIQKDIPIIIASQTLYGRTHKYVYAALRKLSMDLGCIYVEDMLPEVAYVKLGWVLAKTNDMTKVKELMQQNIAGEINNRSTDDVFLR